MYKLTPEQQVEKLIIDSIKRTNNDTVKSQIIADCLIIAENVYNAIYDSSFYDNNFMIDKQVYTYSDYWNEVIIILKNYNV